MMQGRIIIFDSGIGGFSILRQLPSELPVTYLADQQFFPYGDKSQTELSKRLKSIALWAKSQNPALFVVACNTATVNGVAIFRRTLACPVVAVEPVVKMAKGRTLLLATKSTLASTRLAKLQKLHPGSISGYTPVGLPQAIEDMDMLAVRKILGLIQTKADSLAIDALGLSCTHYPLVTAQFREVLGKFTLLDPSPAVANVIMRLLTRHNLPGSQSPIFLTTGNVLRFKEQITYYLGLNVKPRTLRLV